MATFAFHKVKLNKETKKQNVMLKTQKIIKLFIELYRTIGLS